MTYGIRLAEHTWLNVFILVFYNMYIFMYYNMQILGLERKHIAYLVLDEYTWHKKLSSIHILYIHLYIILKLYKR